MPKIIRRKACKAYTSFWINPATGNINGWHEDSPPAGVEAANLGQGWIATSQHAAACGTTLAEIRRELEAE